MINGTLTAKACRAITRNSKRKTIEYRGDLQLCEDLSFQMADSRLETSLHPVHPVHDLALLPSTCVTVPVIRLRRNERQTRIISQKQLYAVGLPRIVKYTSIQSIWGVVAALIG